MEIINSFFFALPFVSLIALLLVPIWYPKRLTYDGCDYITGKRIGENGIFIFFLSLGLLGVQIVKFSVIESVLGVVASGSVCLLAALIVSKLRLSRLRAAFRRREELAARKASMEAEGQSWDRIETNFSYAYRMCNLEGVSKYCSDLADEIPRLKKLDETGAPLEWKVLISSVKTLSGVLESNRIDQMSEWPQGLLSSFEATLRETAEKMHALDARGRESAAQIGLADLEAVKTQQSMYVP